jgi:hypothetical protein
MDVLINFKIFEVKKMNRLFVSSVTVLLAFYPAFCLVLLGSLLCFGEYSEILNIKNGLKYYKCAGQGMRSGSIVFFRSCGCSEFGYSCLC